MRSKIYLLFLFIIILYGCSAGKNDKQEELSTIITGTIIDHDGHFDYAEFNFRDIFDFRKNFRSTKIRIEKNGTFRIDTLLKYPQEISTEYGSIFCSPGDSLALIIKSFNISDVQGTCGKLSIDLLEFHKNIPRYQYGGREYFDTIFQLSPLDYKDHISKREQQYFQLLEEFKRENSTSLKFDKWATDMLKSESWYDIMVYPYHYARRHKIDQNSLDMPGSYYKFLSSPDANKFDLLSEYRTMFLQAYFQYAISTPKDSLKQAEEFFTKGDTASGIGMKLRMIDRNSNGLAKELFFTKFFYSSLIVNDVQLFDAYFDPKFITSEVYLAELNQKYESAKQFLLNQSTPGANIVTSFEDINSDVLKSMINSYPDKVIYIDFWAPWCSPCMEEMKYSKQIQEHFKDDEVVFLFLGNNCNEDTWKATIANKQLTGEHILLNRNQYSELSGLFGIEGIPHYAMIDRAGNIVSKDAFRPSTGEYLKKELNRLLKENRSNL